jgi:hypothetical protein
VPKGSLFDVLTECINYFSENRYTSELDWQKWEERIASAFDESLRFTTDTKFIDQYMRSIFDKYVWGGSVLKSHLGVERYTLDRITSTLRSELDRKILASVNLIKLNREEMRAKTLKRLSGWITSIPSGGISDFDKRKLKTEISKPLRSLPFIERRVLIDQGHKLTNSISTVLANEGGAIAAKWLSHYRQPGYNYREDHKERDGKVYLIRSSWAQRAGLVKPGPDGYSDEITQPAEEVFCRCKWVFVYHLRQLPENMLTVKGRSELKRVKVVA